MANLLTYPVVSGHNVVITYRPVVVEVAEFVGESLHVVWLESRGVTDHIEVGGGHRPLTNTLTHKEEIIPVRLVIS